MALFSSFSHAARCTAAVVVLLPGLVLALLAVAKVFRTVASVLAIFALSLATLACNTASSRAEKAYHLALDAYSTTSAALIAGADLASMPKIAPPPHLAGDSKESIWASGSYLAELGSALSEAEANCEAAKLERVIRTKQSIVDSGVDQHNLLTKPLVVQARADLEAAKAKLPKAQEKLRILEDADRKVAEAGNQILALGGKS